MEQNTKVCVVETNPHNQTSCVWTGATTVAEVIDAMNKDTAFSAEQPIDFLHLNNNFNPDDFLDADGDIDFDKVTEWENSLPIEEHFQEVIECAENDWHIIPVYWTREEDEEACAQRFMNEAVYKEKIDSILR